MSTQSSVLVSTLAAPSRHSICLSCIRELYPEILHEHDILTNNEYHDPQVEFCCFCGWAHKSGVYLECDSERLCNGIHREVPQDSKVSLPVPPAFNKQLIKIISGIVLMCVAACIIAAWLAVVK